MQRSVLKGAHYNMDYNNKRLGTIQMCVNSRSFKLSNIHYMYSIINGQWATMQPFKKKKLGKRGPLMHCRWDWEIGILVLESSLAISVTF